MTMSDNERDFSGWKGKKLRRGRLKGAKELKERVRNEAGNQDESQD